MFDQHRGAALTEFAVLCLAMVPMMLAVPMIGNMVDLRQTSIQAGRYATWQSTVQAPQDQDRALLRDRFFSEADALISSHTTDAGDSVLWGEAHAPTSTLHADSAISIDSASIGMTTRLHDDDQGLGISSGIGAVIETAGDVIGSLSGSEWGIGKTALTRTEVSLAVKSNAWQQQYGEQNNCGGGIGCLRESGAILVDGWSASGSVQARERTQALVPATALQPIGDVVSVLGVVPIFEELGDLDGMFGFVDMEPAPAHANRGLERYEEH